MFCDTQLNSQSRPNWCVDRVHFESLSSSGSTCMHQLGCALFTRHTIPRPPVQDCPDEALWMLGLALAKALKHRQAASLASVKGPTQELGQSPFILLIQRISLTVPPHCIAALHGQLDLFQAQTSKIGFVPARGPGARSAYLHTLYPGHPLRNPLPVFPHLITALYGQFDILLCAVLQPLPGRTAASVAAGPPQRGPCKPGPHILPRCPCMRIQRNYSQQPLATNIFRGNSGVRQDK